MTPTRHPLAWPIGWKRTAPEQRDYGRFAKRREPRQGSSWRPLQDVTLTEASQRLLDELERFGIPEADVVISTNVRTRLDGLPRSGEPEPKDPGAVVYWRDRGNDRCMAIDRYTKVAQNVAALAATIEAMRAIERHGGAVVLDRAFTGFTALPAPIVAGMKRPWRDVLGLGPGGSINADDVQRAYRRLAAEHHPDKGGDPAKMSEVNAARDEALQEVGRG
jgi:hypothetical protein